MNKQEESSGVQFLLGNHAIVEGAIVAGCRYFAGYPITPASEIAERMAERLPQVGGRFIQMEDEIGSIFSVAGASLAGIKAMTATASEGYNYMQEGIGFAVTLEIPCVIVDVQRTRQDIQPTQADVMQVRWGASGDYEIICLAPSSVQEAFDLMIDAFNFAEKYRNPVVVICDSLISHMRGKVIIPDKVKVINRKTPKVPPNEYLPFRADEDGVPPMSKIGDNYRVLYTMNPHDEMGKIIDVATNPDIYEKLYDRICGKILRDANNIAKYETNYLDDADVAVVSYGIEARIASDAVTRARKEGIKAANVKLTTVWPVPSRLLEEIAERVKSIIVPEMSLGKYFREIQRVCCGKTKLISMPKNRGQPHTSEEILNIVRRESK
ncbi:MAG: 2-oxoacid:acceptor oxidoreductase subunit alpha [Candidatus Bathyarchaeia archaeon]